jgi:hypothetical protein
MYVMYELRLRILVYRCKSWHSTTPQNIMNDLRFGGIKYYILNLTICNRSVRSA